MRAPSKRELSELTDRQLATVLRNITVILWDRAGEVEEYEREDLETLTSACGEVSQAIG